MAFGEALHADLERLGNLAKFEATLSGAGAIAQGAGAVAAGAGGVAVGGEVRESVIAFLIVKLRHDRSTRSLASQHNLSCPSPLYGRRVCHTLTGASGVHTGADRGEWAMTFDRTRWKEQLRAGLAGWWSRAKRAGATPVYAGLSAATLWPLVEAARGEGSPR